MLASVLQPLATEPVALRSMIFVLVYSVQIESTEDATFYVSPLSGLRPAALGKLGWWSRTAALEAVPGRQSRDSSS